MSKRASQSSHRDQQDSAKVDFRGADISLNPDPEWQRLSTGPFTEAQSICLPVLKTQGTNGDGLIQVFTSAANSDVKTAANILKTKVESDPNTIKGTYNQEEFRFVYRGFGIKASYDYKVSGRVPDGKLTSYVFLIQNKKGKCVMIHYLTLGNKDSSAVDRMVQSTLRVN